MDIISVFFLAVLTLYSAAAAMNNHKKKGEIIVSGSDSLIIPLHHHRPRLVSVYVREHLKQSSCNPAQNKVEWDILEPSVHNFELKLTWDVSDSVTICYEIVF